MPHVALVGVLVPLHVRKVMLYCFLILLRANELLHDLTLLEFYHGPVDTRTVPFLFLPRRELQSFGWSLAKPFA